MADGISDSLPRLIGTGYVRLVVNNTPILIQLDGNDAPITAGNFTQLVSLGVYDDVPFHRIVKEPTPFVVQGGDPQGKDPNFPLDQLGTGDFIDPATSQARFIPLEIKPEGATEPIYGKTFPEAGITVPPVLKHDKGAVAMARTQAPDTASAQFYFALDSLPFLDGNYAVFGYVRQGFDEVEKIQLGDRIQSALVTQGLNNLVVGPSKTFVVNTLKDEDNNNNTLSLREALKQANASAGKDVIQFSDSLAAGTINLNLAKDLAITDDVIIKGLGADKLTINGRSRNINVFNIDNNDSKTIQVAMDGLTITGARKSGIFNAENLEVTNSNIIGNRANAGGGINNRGTLSISDSTLARNVSKTTGGGILNNGQLNLTNVTISANTAKSGGGIDNLKDGKANITNTTITANAGGLLSEGTVSVGNTIISANSKSDVNYVGDTNPFESLGGNVIGVGKGISNFTKTSDETNIKDPKLLPLTNNGGGTLTQALRFNSLAINTGLNDLVLLPFDQIGDSRTVNNKVDSGAYELLIAKGKKGTAASEAVVGTDKKDSLSGLGGKDTLYGLGGADKLLGNVGEDLLIGGPGRDTLTGGGQLDSFLFDSPKEGIDTITDKSVGEHIFVSAAGFRGGLKPGELPQNQFVLSNNASGKDYRFIYNKGNGRLFFDPDGQGGSASQQIATLSNKPDLIYSDIIVF